VVLRTNGSPAPAARRAADEDDGMGLSFVLDPVLDDDLRTRVVGLWTDATNAGGAVGFAPPVTAADVWPTADAAFAGVDSGLDHLLAGFDGPDLAALLFLAGNSFAFKAHWRVLKRVMVAPGCQGRGYGAALMREAAVVARGLGAEALQVTVRGGTGTDGFYARLGYREVGRLPGALRVGPGDDRDEIIMWLPLPARDRR
jgi:GNAT superfamily N-acetyltransferase